MVSREKLIARKLSLSLAVTQHFCGIVGVFGCLSKQVIFLQYLYSISMTKIITDSWLFIAIFFI
jgi:hypothetical protein